MTITPIFTRELVAAARGARLHWNRWVVVAILLAIVAGTFAVRSYEAGGIVSNNLMAIVAQQSFLLIVAYHALWIFAVPAQAARCIAQEKDRRTLDFLLATRLGNAEVVLAKLSACLVVSLTTIGTGLPVMMLLVLLGGVDYRLILLTYACVASTTFFLAVLSIWASTAAPDVRRAVSLAVLGTIAWLMGPMVVAVILPRFGVHLPHWASTANAWLLASSPGGLLLNFTGGFAPGDLVDSVARMIGLQALGGSLLLIWAIAQLRSAYRDNVGGDGRGLGRARLRPAWRFRPRPAVGDDPILWRVKYTTRANLFEKVVGFVYGSGILATLAFATCYFARPAIIEVWHHGYSSGLTSANPPEMNLFTRLFVAPEGANSTVDLGRTEFNLFLRYISAMIAFFIAMLAMGFSAEVVDTERRRETWDGLLATPLAARDIARAQMLAAAWRLRWPIGTLIVLWTIGLIAGAIHPLGYVLALLALAVSTWSLAMLGTIASLRSKELVASLPALAVLTLLGSSVLPFILPSRFGSVLLGAGSAPFVEWLLLVSYRDVRAALHYTSYPLLGWMGITAGEGLLLVVATCLIGIVAPVLVGRFAWRYVNANFDRLVGRPWRGPAVAIERIVPEPAAIP